MLTALISHPRRSKAMNDLVDRSRLTKRFPMFESRLCILQERARHSKSPPSSTLAANSPFQLSSVQVPSIAFLSSIAYVNIYFWNKSRQRIFPILCYSTLLTNHKNINQSIYVELVVTNISNHTVEHLKRKREKHLWSVSVFPIIWQNKIDYERISKQESEFTFEWHASIVLKYVSTIGLVWFQRRVVSLSPEVQFPRSGGYRSPPATWRHRHPSSTNSIMQMRWFRQHENVGTPFKILPRPSQKPRFRFSPSMSW